MGHWKQVMQVCGAGIRPVKWGRHTVDPDRHTAQTRGDWSATAIGQKEMVYTGPKCSIPRAISPSLSKRLGFDIFRTPLDLACSLTFYRDWEIENDAVGASVDGGWIVRYASTIHNGLKSYYMKRYSDGPLSVVAATEGRTIIDTDGLRVLELVFGRVEIVVPQKMRQWIDQHRQSRGC